VSFDGSDKPVFLFDFNSPFAYLAAMRIDSLLPDAEWRPVAFPLMLAQLGRLEAALERDFPSRLAEVRERAAARGLPPVEPPEGWPTEVWSLTPLRAAVFASERSRTREFSTAAFKKVYAESRSLTDPATLADAAREAGLDPAEVEDAVQRPEIKERLKRHTEGAVAQGVTGIPTVVVGGELFWGDDRLEEAAAAAA
jgi:2-hydroxychromene-2-carboxylate isomerase